MRPKCNVPASKKRPVAAGPKQRARLRVRNLPIRVLFVHSIRTCKEIIVAKISPIDEVEDRIDGMSR